MEVVEFLIYLGIILIIITIIAFFWAVRSGQFDDLDGPAHRILMDEDICLDDDHNDSKKNNLIE